MTVERLERMNISDNVKELVLEQAYDNKESYGTPLETSIRIQLSAFVPQNITINKFF